MMKCEYDKQVDAAYVYLQYPLKEGEVKKTIEVDKNIILDYDKTGKLVGVEILNASKVMNKNALSKMN